MEPPPPSAPPPKYDMKILYVNQLSPVVFGGAGSCREVPEGGAQSRHRVTVGGGLGW
jgi:hypothetical protein